MRKPCTRPQLLRRLPWLVRCRRDRGLELQRKVLACLPPGVHIRVAHQDAAGDSMPLLPTRVHRPGGSAQRKEDRLGRRQHILGLCRHVVKLLLLPQLGCFRSTRASHQQHSFRSSPHGPIAPACAHPTHIHIRTQPRKPDPKRAQFDAMRTAGLGSLFRVSDATAQRLAHLSAVHYSCKLEEMFLANIFNHSTSTTIPHFQPRKPTTRRCQLIQLYN
mmetsp:Transcript_13315/g.36791  ORF Transcript_13315/g.36791 Transcript_13315/m.36791 type:complete len:218 (-) Transcript_13315:3323-3976(-)